MISINPAPDRGKKNILQDSIRFYSRAKCLRGWYNDCREHTRQHGAETRCYGPCFRREVDIGPEKNRPDPADRACFSKVRSSQQISRRMPMRNLHFQHGHRQAQNMRGRSQVAQSRRSVVIPDPGFLSTQEADEWTQVCPGRSRAMSRARAGRLS